MRDAAKNIQYVIPVGNAWAVKSGNNTKFTLIASTKKEAVAFAKQMAKNYESDLIVYGKNGQVLLMNSYNKKGSKITAKA